MFPNQNEKPKLVFVFGAGASCSAGVPIQSEILPMIFDNSNDAFAHSTLVERIRQFVRDNFSVRECYPSLEEVFGFIEFFLRNELSLSKDWGQSELLGLRNDLKKLIHFLISSKTTYSGSFRTFFNSIDVINRNVGIITTNYDTLIDEAMSELYSRCLIDYCLDLVNYRHPDKINPFDWWDDPKKEVTIFDDICPTRIKLVKLHGSLNWKYCPCCGQVVLTPWGHEINLATGHFESGFEEEMTVCPFDGTLLGSLLQPPTHLKSNTNYIFQKLFDEASFLVQNASFLVFVGYSFPEADIHIRALIKRSFPQNGQILVINKSCDKSLRSRYTGLSNNVDFCECEFEKFIYSKMFKNLLSNTK